METEDLDHLDYAEQGHTQPDFPDEAFEAGEESTHENPGVLSAHRGWPMMVVSLLILATGGALALGGVLAPQRVLPVTSVLSAAGFTPGLLTALGMVLFITTRLMSRINQLGHQLAEHTDWVCDSSVATGEDLEILMDSQEQMEDQRAGSIEDLGKVVDAVAHQDQKITSLANTLRMYGKPLSEVSRHVTELAALSKSTAVDLEPLTRSLQDSLNQAVRKISDDMNSIIERIPTDNGAATILDEARAISDQLLLDITQIMGSHGAHADTADIAGLRAEIDALQSSVRGLSSTEDAHDSGHPRVEEPAAPAAAKAPEDTPDEPTEPATGGGKSTAEGVFDAIAKLKQMRP